MTSAAATDGLPDPDQFDFIKQRGEKRLIVVAAAPRSGSTYLSNVLSEVTGFQYFRLCSGYSSNEHDLYLPALCLMNPHGCVSQLHMKGTFHNASLIKAFGIRPVILVRNIYDTVLSLLANLRNKEKQANYGTGKSGYSFIWLTENTRNMDDEQLLDMIIDLAIPWYVNFYASWDRLCEQHAVDALWVTYEDIMENKSRTIQNIVKHVEIKNNTDFAMDILEKKHHTFREGISGYGEACLTEPRKKKICSLFSHYTNICFDKYGL